MSHHPTRRMVGSDTYHFYYGAVRVGIVCEQKHANETVWTWQCGFYPGPPIGDHRCGEAPTLEIACVEFELAWAEYLPRRTPAEFEAWHADQLRSLRKLALWYIGKRLELFAHAPQRLHRPHLH